MKITKEQKKRILELDPNFFGVKLVVGKWYRHIVYGYSFCFNGKMEDGSQYGVDVNSKWTENISSHIRHLHNFVPATDKEVEEALTKEKIKRGYAKGNFICLFDKIIANYTNLSLCYNEKENRLWNENGVVFEKGIWAKMAITKAEAEKLLNKIIV